MCKRVHAKTGEVLTTPEMLEDCKKKPRHSQRKKKSYQRKVNVMNVKDHEEQEDMEISQKVGWWHSLQHLSYVAENLGQYKEGNVAYTLYSTHVR